MTASIKPLTQEEVRLSEERTGQIPWRRWGPYLSERQWGTVREDYSPYGTAWEYLSHDHARSRAYRWGEDGIAGISDEQQNLCFSLALWNGKDPILKERLFGLTGNEGNHGEDVKEYYFYLDNLPTHSYMKYLYKYPQNAFPYQDLVETNKKRNRHEFEYELLDTGIFEENRYFDVFVEYAKADAETIFIRISIANRGPEEAVLHLLPTLWFRNTWSWTPESEKPSLTLEKKSDQLQIIKASYSKTGTHWLYCKAPSSVLFTENETNYKKLFNNPNQSPYVKDAFHEYLVHSNLEAVNPQQCGTKAAAYYPLKIAAGESQIIQLCLSHQENDNNLFKESFDALFTQRKSEADAFYNKVTPYPLSDDMKNVQRQAFAGLLWSKQHYHYSVEKWLQGDPTQPPPPEERKNGRNHDWPYLNADDIISMPDKWEYPWFAAWDLAFHATSLARIDPDFAKRQLILMTREWYMSPDGLIPAYEWSFGDVNPPVHAWATFRVYELEKEMYGRKDREFLEKVFQKLLINFTWWVNRKDSSGKNVFEGGFLGLDNIGAFDRTRGSPIGGILEQPDGTGWMGMYCLNLFKIALELAIEDDVYEDMATKFFEHFIYIADAINNVSDENKDGLWDNEHAFYYASIQAPDGKRIRIKTDSFVGIIPLFAVTVNDPIVVKKFPHFQKRFNWFIQNQPSKLKNIAELDRFNPEEKTLFAFVDTRKLTEIFKKVLDTSQFLSPFGIRSVSKKLATDPFIINLDGSYFKLDYEPRESTNELFGGNSNWRGPVWFPLNFLLIESLQDFHYYYEDYFKIECPTGSEKMLNLSEVAQNLMLRLISIFLKDSQQRRPVYGGIEKFQNDPHWRDYILFYEYFNGDDGAGLGASHQTGWTGLVACLIHEYAEFSSTHHQTDIAKRTTGNDYSS